MPTNYPSVLEIPRVPGYLYWEPTALDVEAHYGTLLGFTETGVEFDPGIKVILLPGEENGVEPILAVYAGEAPQVKCTLKNFNATAIPRLFPGGLGTASTAFWAQGPGSALAGVDIFSSTYVGHLLFMPDDKANNPIFLAQQASCFLIGSLVFSRQKDMDFTCVFPLKRKGTTADGLYFVGPAANGAIR